MAKYAIDNRELYLEIKLSKGSGRLTRPAQKILLMLAKNLVRKKQYYDEDDRADCLKMALLLLFSQWHNFNEDKFSNAFAYFTEVAKRGLAQGLKEVHGKRGEDAGYKVRTVSINSANGGLGMFNV